SGRVNAIPNRPASSSFAALDWTPDGRIVFVATPPAGRQNGSSQQVLGSAVAKWTQAWRGQEPQVTVRSAHPLVAETRPSSGELVLVDPRLGTAEKLADGDYAAISVSADGRHVAAVRLAEPVPNALSLNGERTELQIFAITSAGAR